MARVPVSILGIPSPLAGCFLRRTPPESALLRVEPERVQLTALQPGQVTSHLGSRPGLAPVAGEGPQPGWESLGEGCPFTTWFSLTLVEAANMVSSG